MTLLTASRSENPDANITDCTEKVDRLYKAGEKRWGTDEKVFYEIFLLLRQSKQIIPNNF